MTPNADLLPDIRRRLRLLAAEIGARPVGSEANRRAARAIAEALAGSGGEVALEPFECLDWEVFGCELLAAGTRVPAQANPFCPPCDVTAPAVPASTLPELEAAELAGRVAVLHGGLVAEPLMPLNFPFIQFEEHQRIVRSLQGRGAVAAVAVSPEERWPRPFINDGDVSFPSLTVPASAGAALLQNTGGPLTVRVQSVIRPAQGENPAWRRVGSGEGTVVVCAHMDTIHGTRGALDNASGVAALLALPALLHGRELPYALELVPFNGEDYYSAAGEVAWLRARGDSLEDVLLCVNVDGVGRMGVGNTIAFFGCPEVLETDVRAMLASRTDMAPTDPWPAGDHSTFAMRGVPAIALTSAEHPDGQVLYHTPLDTVDMVDVESVAAVARFVAELLTGPAVAFAQPK